MKRRQHLHLLPPPRSPRPFETIDGAALLARAAARGDLEKATARDLLTASRQADIIDTLTDRLDATAEELGEWRRRALAAEAQLRRPSVAAGWWALAALGWGGFWGIFETPMSTTDRSEGW
jgi:hypothetical protein